MRTVRIILCVIACHFEINLTHLSYIAAFLSKFNRNVDAERKHVFGDKSDKKKKKRKIEVKFG